MGKSLRLSETWFRRGLWLVAAIFAFFLINLGGTVVNDLPKVEKPLELADFLDKKTSQALNGNLKTHEQTITAANAALEQAELQLETAQKNTQAAQATFNNWLATRQATQQASQDQELVARTKALDALKDKERLASSAIEKQNQIILDANQSYDKTRRALDELESVAQTQLNKEYRSLELRVFLYRLALTLPLLVLAGWLFAKKRKSTYWPFVWGYIGFALFAFFVELVPYMPSYGGYVRYTVGVVITVLIGRQAIIALNNYLEKQKLVEQLPDQQRREELSYDTALTRLAKGVCPGCERAVDLKNPDIDFCPHCGISLFNHCHACTTRKSAFAKYCHACGEGAGEVSTAG